VLWNAEFDRARDFIIAGVASVSKYQQLGYFSSHKISQHDQRR
jgi:hypothetical protein